MTIVSAKSVPRVLGLYFNKGEISIDDICEFKNIFKKSTMSQMKDGRYGVFIDKDSNVIKFFMDKSKLDRYYICGYEVDLEIPRSVSNEAFEIELDDETSLSVYIYEYIENLGLLVLEREN